MKRQGNLFSTLVSIENLRLAHLNARKGKGHYEAVRMVDADPDPYILDLQEALISGTFTTSSYTTKIVYEPKQRVIFKLPYLPDRVVHHAIMQVMQRIWDRLFIHDLYSAIPGKGLHAGSYRLRRFLKNADQTRYCLKFDISKFYPSIRPDKLFEIVQRTVKDPGVLGILRNVIYSTPNAGVPIGNYLSQYFSNLYLTPFDHWLKEKIRARYYIRYCDDGVILHRDKGWLQDLLPRIEEYFDTLGLKLNPKTSIFPVDRCGVDFLGYRSFRTHTILRKSSARRLKKRVREIEQNYQTMNPDEILGSLGAYHGWLKHCDCYNFARTYLYENPAIRTAVDYAVETKGIKCPNWLEAPSSRRRSVST